jgi:hypothetical protein
MIIKQKHGRLESLPHQVYPTTQTLYSKPSILAMPTSLLPSEGFMIFKNKIPATSIRQKPISKLSQVAHIKVSILNKFYKTLTSHKSLI